MKKRLISLLLAFSMMLTFLPAGAVSAFAEENIGDIIADGAAITDSGTYQLKGPYTQGITINTDGPVEINVTGNVTVDFPENNKNYYFITIEKADSVTINDDAQYPVIVNGGSVISNEGGNLTVNRGKYICNGRNRYFFAFDFSNGINQVENVTIESKYGAIRATLNCKKAVIESSIITAKWAYDGAIQCWPREYSSIMELNNLEVEAEERDALRVETGTVTVNGGNYKSSQGCAIGTRNNTDTNLNLTINGGTYQGYNYDWTVADFGCHGHPRDPRECNIHIYGSTFVGGRLLRFYGDYAKTLTIDDDTTFRSMGGTRDAVVVGDGQLFFNSGTIEVSGGSQRSALCTFEKGEAIVNGGTFKGAKCDIYEQNDDYRVLSPDRVHLNHANFDDIVCNVYLEKDLQIDVAQNYTGQVTIECADPKDGRQLTKATETNYQKDLNLTSANAGYLVGYKTEDGKEYRCLSKEVGVTIEGLENADIKEGKSKDFTVKVDPKGCANLGEAIIDFGDKNGEIEYKDKNGEYKLMPDDGLPIINLASNNNDYAFRITPKNAGEQTLTAAVVRDAVEVGKDSETYHVAGRVHATVTIEGLENAVIKEGESKDFTVKVTPNDDAKLGEAVIDFGDKNSEIEYKDENNEYKPMPKDGLPIDKNDYAFRITPKETGKQTLTAAVKKGENELARDEKDFVVSEMPILTLKDGVITSVTVPGKNGADPEDITEIVKKNANEDGSFHVPEGATVSVAFDKDAFADSGLKFGHWDITGLDDPNAYQDKESFAFEMPAKAVTLKAMTQDASIEDDEPDIVGPIVIGTTVVVGGAVLGYQAYSLGAEFAGKLMALPYFPSNRSALAMMLWEDAGKPMPESELLYPDVEQEERDMDLQHAARWAMENELIPDLNDEGTAPEEMKFYPDNAVSKIDVLNAWQKAQELKQNA